MAYNIKINENETRKLQTNINTKMSITQNNNFTTTTNQTHHETIMRTETVTTTSVDLFTGDMTKSKIEARCLNAMEQAFDKFDQEAKRTNDTEEERTLDMAWETAKLKGQWITAQDACLMNTLEQKHTEVGGYMCNPVNTRLMKVYRKGKLPKGTWHERQQMKRAKTMKNAYGNPDYVGKLVDACLTKTCTKCLRRGLLTSGTLISSASPTVNNDSRSDVEADTSSFSPPNRLEFRASLESCNHTLKHH
jgi:hypothetical protein